MNRMPSPVCPPALVALIAASAPPVLAQSAGKLAFAWPVPCEARVTETVHKRGRDMEVRYTLRLERAAEGDDLILRVRDFEPVRYGEMDLSDPRIREALAPVLTASKLLPDLRVTRDGQFVAAVDLQQSIDAVIGLVERDSPRGARLAKDMRRMFRSEQARAMVEQTAAEAWRSWIEVWLDREIPTGGTLDTERTDLAPSGAVIRIPCRFEHHGSAGGASERPADVRLSMQAVIEGEEAAAALLASMRSLIDDAKGKPMPEVAFDEFRIVTRVEAVTDPETLQPRRIVREKIVRLRVPGERTHQQTERHEYHFAWLEQTARPPQTSR